MADEQRPKQYRKEQKEKRRLKEKLIFCILIFLSDPLAIPHRAATDPSGIFSNKGHDSSC